MSKRDDVCNLMNKIELATMRKQHNITVEFKNSNVTYCEDILKSCGAFAKMKLDNVADWKVEVFNGYGNLIIKTKY